MQNDFNAIRNAGLKCIVRFAYSDNTNGALDASKDQILAHLNQLQPLLTNNADIIAVVQAGFIGSWGEWYYTDHFGMSPTATDYQNRKAVVDGILNAIPTTRMVQMRTPSLKQKSYGTTAALTQAQAYSGTNIARIGHHNDCFLASSTDFGTYGNTSTEYPYLAQETLYTPMGGETCAVNLPRSGCSTAVSEMSQFHWSFMNLDYNADVINGFKSGSCFSEIQNRLGYRLALTSSEIPQSANQGSSMTLKFSVNNTGFAAPFNPRTVYAVLRNASTGQEYKFALTTDLRKWAAGTTQTITESIALPADMVTGSYKLYLSLPDTDSRLNTRPEYSIQLANQSTWESNTGYNNMNQTITVNTASSGSGTADSSQVKLYPVPANTILNAESSTINTYQLEVYNSLGRKMSVSSTSYTGKVVFDTTTLENGIYILKVSNGSYKKTYRFSVQH